MTGFGHHEHNYLGLLKHLEQAIRLFVDAYAKANAPFCNDVET